MRVPSKQADEAEIRVLTVEDAEAQLSRADELKASGGELIFRISEAVLDTHRARFRATYPNAALRPIPSKFNFTLDRPVAYQRKDLWLAGVKNFRDLPPIEKAKEKDPPGGGYSISYIGSGVPASEHPLAKDWFSRCMRCAGTDTRIIRASHSTHYGRVETWVWNECEYECLECGWFTYHQVNDEY